MKTATGFAMLLLIANSVQADQPKELPSAFRGVAFEQRLDAQVPLDIPFHNEVGTDVTLGDYLRDRPVILVLVQYRCPMLCTEVLNSLGQSLRGLPFEMGKDYDVLTVSFDAREEPELAAAKKRQYVENLGRPDAERGWHFLTGGQPAIDRLTEAVGFRYRYDSATDQFAHASGIMIMTPEGRLSRYFYGLSYHPRDLRLGLVEASRGQVSTPVDQVLLLCFHYDPAQGTYTAAVMNVVRAGGVLTMLALGGFIGFHFLRDWRRGQIGRKPATQLTTLA
jgi:protein SCO1